MYEEIVDALGDLHGVHPGYRAAHAKGVFCRGTFTATPQARELTRAAHMQGDPVDVLARFSNGSGNPEAPDADRREGRGMATSFRLPDGDRTDIVAISIPVFFVRTAEDFLEFVRARKPDPETGEMDMEKIGAFVAAHPETQAALELILPTLVPPASYAECAYNGLHAFAFADAAGERRFGRYRWEPDAGARALPDEEIEASGPDYLQEEIADRLAAGPVGFTLRMRLAEDDDPLEDPTVPWPEERPEVTLGALTLTDVDADAERDDELIVFDPTKLTDGIEPSDDEILATRPHAYAVSAERRSAAGRTAAG
ncbi:MAG TPA: catalase family peroxidase [Solirubrobacterales bacterium]|nr:catalase family peroxidase [Solirubrobacterales bacterium]